MGRDVVTNTVAISVEAGSPQISAYLARPAAHGRYSSCIICPEIFGLTAHIREAAERLAGEGIVNLSERRAEES